VQAEPAGPNHGRNNAAWQALTTARCAGVNGDVGRKPRVFVTDGSYPNGLAAVRALNQDGFRVTAGERAGTSLARTISFWSRHCAERFHYPDPRDRPNACVSALDDHFRDHNYDAAIPVGLDMVELFVRHRDAFRVPLMLPPCDSFSVAADKRLTFEHAASIGMPIPRTVPAERWRDLELPVVFKHPRTGVVIAHSPDAATQFTEQLGSRIGDHVVQEYIPGENGFGYFGFFQHGRECGYFLHERLMQFPKEGGPSVVARSIRNSRLRELGRSLLESLCWHGIAMVEFKRSDRNHQFYLMEINPKLWGSLDLAIQSGCNFPAWIARSLMGDKMPSTDMYREGVTYQWVIPNGIKCFLRYRDFRVSFLRNLASPSVRTDLRWLDPLPAAAGLFAMATHLVKP
jgi:predicted ATP-grasp superfamily ATP-dependent carboligase